MPHPGCAGGAPEPVPTAWHSVEEVDRSCPGSGLHQLQLPSGSLPLLPLAGCLLERATWVSSRFGPLVLSWTPLQAKVGPAHSHGKWLVPALPMGPLGGAPFSAQLLHRATLYNSKAAWLTALAPSSGMEPGVLVRPITQERVHEWLEFVAMWLPTSSGFLNCFVYFWINRRFRHKFQTLGHRLCRLCCRAQREPPGISRSTISAAVQRGSFSPEDSHSASSVSLGISQEPRPSL
uniref:Uncharacterized protein n=1 Tax=Sphaerodactylus townsendi TaxID=933632 RepID=A0ACB8EB58_9SAUR